MGTFTKGNAGLLQTATLLLLCALFFILAVGGIATGISAYNGTVEIIDSTNATRTALAYITNQSRRGDFSGGIQVGTIFGLDTLVLREYIPDGEGSNYIFCTYIYAYDGLLWELYVEEGFEADMYPGAGTNLIALDSMDITAENGLVTVTVRYGGHSGSITLYSRSSEEVG